MRWFALAFVLIASLVQAADRPNVILIMTDDQGFPDIGVNGNTLLKTPHMDAMAKRSVTMNNFYVSPVCTPTRACLMTGRYNYRTRAIDTYQGRAMMEPSEVTVAEVLRDAGYATGHFGKWHLGDNYPLRSIDQGFEESLYILGGGLGQPQDLPGSEGKYTDAIMLHNGKPVQTRGYCTDVYFDAALDWIGKQKQAGKPFFVYLPTNAPHGPYHDVPKKWLEYYKSIQIDETTIPKVPGGQPLGKLTDSDTLARLYAMISNIDDNLGKLFTRLDEMKLTDNTLVIFMTDNGPATHGYNAGLRGYKSTSWEGGVRSFFFAHWPGRLKAGTSNNTPAAHIDIMPTILEVCGVAKPADVKFDGRSILPLLEGRKTDWPQRTLFFQSHRGDAPEIYRNFCAQTPEWKLVSSGTFGDPPGNAKGKNPKAKKNQGAPSNAPAPLPGAGMQLFHISEDRYEMNDVASQHPEIVAKLKAEYEAWFKDVSTTRPDNYAPPTILLGDDHENPSLLSRQNWRGRPNEQRTLGGFWIVKFTRPGQYAFRSIVEPVKQPAKVVITWNDAKIGTVDLPAGATEVTFETALNDQQAGHGNLAAYVDTGDGQRGVRFLEVTRK